MLLKLKLLSLSEVVKTGRTHLMDAMPLTFGQELNAWASQIKDIKSQFVSTITKPAKTCLGRNSCRYWCECSPSNVLKSYYKFLMRKQV